MTVFPYNSCYLPDHDERVERRGLNPVETWLEDRWVLTRRIYGSELTQKLFMQCWNWIFACNKIQGNLFHEIQDEIVSRLFNQDPKTFFKQMNKNTWIKYWDETCEGYITQNTMHNLAKKINILGPIAAIFGRDFELYIASEHQLTMCPIDKVDESIEKTMGTLDKGSFEPNHSSWEQWNYSDNGQNWQDRGQSSSEWHERGQSSSEWHERGQPSSEWI